MGTSAAKYRVCLVAVIFYRQEQFPQIWSPRVTKSAGQTLSSLSIFQFLLSNCKLNWDLVYLAYPLTNVNSGTCYSLMIHFSGR